MDAYLPPESQNTFEYVYEITERKSKQEHLLVSIDLGNPKKFTTDKKQPKKTREETTLKKSDLQASAIIRIPHKNQKPAQTYSDLKRTPEDERIIFELIDTMASRSKLWLLWNKGYMNSLGDSVKHVHPLRFMGYILGTPHLKNCLRIIFDDFFKRKGFMDGLGPSLDNEMKKNNIYKYIKDFANECEAPVAGITSYIDRSDWWGFVKFLMNQ